MRYLILLAALTGLGACGTTDSTRLANVQVSFATQRPGPALHRTALGDTIAEGGDTLVITRAEIVLREIELKRVEQADCTSDACERFETGPVLVDLPLTAGIRQQFAVDVPAGSYNEIEFDIHKPDDGDPQDQAFVAAHPAFADISVRVTGTFNGQAFTYTSDLNVEQELALSPALVIVDAASATNLTILVDIRTWFRDEAGTLVNPAQANKDGPFESIVRNRIQDSVEAFEDDDHDGGEDD
jgi:hypothetical protein